MTKVVPYIETIGSDDFKLFLSQPFVSSMLSNQNGDDVYFSQWRDKNMGNWMKYINDEGVILEFYSSSYDIIHPKCSKISLPLPNTLNDFINDSFKYNVQLFWGDLMDFKFQPKDYLHKDEISAYFVNLLAKMDKSKELIL